MRFFEQEGIQVNAGKREDQGVIPRCAEVCNLSKGKTEFPKLSLVEMCEPSSRIYRDASVIGRGCLGRVYKAFRRDTGAVVAVRDVDLRRFDEAAVRHLFEQEKTGVRLLHPFIVQNYSVTKNKEEFSLHIEMEYCADGSLDDLRWERKMSHCYIPEYRIWEIIVQIAGALVYMHDPNKPGGIVLHKNLKLSNVLANGHAVKIGDVGLPEIDYTKRPDYHVFEAYRAPEATKFGIYDTASDIWAFGVMLLELCTFKQPNWKPSLLTMAPRYELWEEYSDDLYYLIEDCLKLKSSERLTAGDIYLHPQAQEALRRLKEYE